MYISTILHTGVCTAGILYNCTGHAALVSAVFIPTPVAPSTPVYVKVQNYRVLEARSSNCWFDFSQCVLSLSLSHQLRQIWQTNITEKWRTNMENKNGEQNGGQLPPTLFLFWSGYNPEAIHAGLTFEVG